MGTDGPTPVLEPLWRFPATDSERLWGSATCALAPRHEAVRSAREFTRRTLRRWESGQDLDDVTLVVSELVTNALRHGLPGGVNGESVRLQLMRWSARLVCAVRDPSVEPPQAVGRPPLTDAGADAGTGAGVRTGSCDPLDDPTVLADIEALEGFPGASAESGRGLHLVDSFSDGWGWHRLAGSRPGKVVWAMFRAER